MNKALEWLLENDFRAEKPKLGKFGERKGQPIGMQTTDARTGYRVEYDERNGAHINVWTHKKKALITRLKARQKLYSNSPRGSQKNELS
ncbi:hypothetical protein [Pseudomonas poae]|uniref:hypothetical protein n=1 Tax=Pseudomonas poae TaxID=200451 RepID=UPI0030DF6F58